MNGDPGDDFIEAGGRGAVGTAGLWDVRSRRLVVVSHCLLDQNTRYPGGAVCPGAVVPALQEYLDSGVGLLQMPCPEQRTWGGVRRPPLLWVLRHRRLAWGLRWLMPVLRRYLRWRYGRLARTVTRDVADAARSGQRVVGVVGVAGSPSCGVHTTLDLRAALRRLSQDEHPLTAPWLSNDVVGAAERPGAGIYTQALRERFAADGVDVPFIEYRLPDSDR
jgi:predicted secreted protein